MSNAVLVVSGGLDSITMLYQARQVFADGITSLVSFNYGQRHNKELQYAKHHADALGLKHHIIDLSKSGMKEAFAPSGSSLVTDADVPEGHYAEDNMKSTVVPNRNMIMLSIAVGIAVSEDANFVGTGVHAGDHFIYPDCRPDFLLAASSAGFLGNEGFGHFAGIWAPFVRKTKADIAITAFSLGVPIDQTWSCYKGGEKHCGKCGTCVERLEAIAEAQDRIVAQGYPRPMDLTEYEDTDYWHEALANAPKEA